jgi:hypothetical protein
MRQPQIAACCAFWLVLGGTERGLRGGETTPAEPVALRAQSFLGTPTNRPAALVLIKNLQDTTYRGTVTVHGPANWRIVPKRQEVSLNPGETKQVSFDVEKGLAVRANSYPLVVSATGAGQTVTHHQNVVCAVAPYDKPTIDGDPSDWDNAMPVMFTVEGKKTVISTLWNRRQFSILVAVEEERLVHYRAALTGDGCDGVQLALAPRGAVTGTSPDEVARRFEFLLVAAGEGSAGRCFRLASPGMPLAETSKPRELEPLEYDQATVAVSRVGTTTYYECGLSFRPMRDEIEPIEGREFYLSALIHDPDGTGIRDWGQAAGLWPWQRNPLAWSRFDGAKWPGKLPLDSKTLWGFYSSKK